MSGEDNDSNGTLSNGDSDKENPLSDGDLKTDNRIINGHVEFDDTFTKNDNGALSNTYVIRNGVDNELIEREDSAQETKSDSSSMGDDLPKSEEKGNPKKQTRRPVTKSKSFVIRKPTSSPLRSSGNSHQSFNKKFPKKKDGKHNQHQTSSYDHFNRGKSNYNRPYSGKDQGFSKSYNVERFENTFSSQRKVNPSTWSLYNSDILENIKEINSIPKYAIAGFHVAQSTKVTSDSFVRYDFDKMSMYEKVFKQQVYLQIMTKFSKQIKYEDYNGKDASLKAVCSDIIDADISLKESTLNVLIKASILSEELLNKFYGDKLLLQKKLPVNRFSLSGVSDLASFGEDILGNRFKYLMLFKVSFEKFVLSRHICELFLHGLIMDITTLHLLYYHLNEGTLAIYEFKFKFDKLKEYTKTTKVKQICENLFKGVYGHFECKILFRDAKDIEASKRR